MSCAKVEINKIIGNAKIIYETSKDTDYVVCIPGCNIITQYLTTVSVLHATPVSKGEAEARFTLIKKKHGNAQVISYKTALTEFIDIMKRVIILL